MAKSAEPHSAPRVFVSFATNDGLNRHLLMRLEAQALQVWDFQRVSMAIPVGSSIKEACFREIDAARLFAVIVTDRALSSRWVERELSHALSQSKVRQLPIVPIFSNQLSQVPMEHPLLQNLSDYRGCHVDPDNPASIEQAVEQICGGLGVAHRPPNAEDPRLPFTARLYREIRECVAETPYGSDVYQRAIRTVIEFQHAFEHDRFEQAHLLSSYLIAMLRHEYPTAPLYYPTIAQSICLCQMKRYDDALRELSSLSRRLTTNADPKKVYPDDNLHGAIGLVHFERGDFSAAKAEYIKALALNPDDAANLMSYLVLRVHSGEKLDTKAIGEELRKVRHDRFLPGDALQVEVSTAFAYAIANHREEAMRRYATIVEPILARVATGDSIGQHAKYPLGDAVLQYVQLILGDTRPPSKPSLHEAKRILESWLTLNPDHAESLIALGNTCIDQGDLDTAIVCYERLRRLATDDWQLQYEAMRGLWQAGACAPACEVARHILEGEAFGLPREPQQFFITGAANWVLERWQRAQYDFARSGRDEQWNYANYLHH